MLAMHMANELLTPGVAAVFCALSGGVLVYAARRTGSAFDSARVPLMGVLGAFVFAAQMINFPVLPGTSGHLGGGVLLAILLGPHAATLVMASILIVQCLIFQDGGLLALGTNIWNLGIIPCYAGFAIFRALAGGRASAPRLYASVFAATMTGMLAGAAMVPVQAGLSGVLAIPFGRFLLVMLGLHLVVALVEALVTFGVIAYVGRVRPELLGASGASLGGAAAGLSRRAVLSSLLVVALLLGGVVSLFASEWPDALDSITGGGERTLVAENPNPTIHAATELQERIAPLPEYRWTSMSGVLGAGVTLALVWLIGWALRRSQRVPLPADEGRSTDSVRQPGIRHPKSSDASPLH